MAAIRPTGIYNYASRLGGMVQRAKLMGTTPSSNKALALDFRPLLPMIIAGSALLYNQGQEANKPGGGEGNAWLRLLTESGLAYLLLENTTGVYPLLGVGLAAYRAGQQTTALDQIKAVINTAATMFLGSLGVTFFKGMSNTASQMDDEAILRRLHDRTALGAPAGTHIQDWLAHLDHQARDDYWQDDTKQAFQELHHHLQQLKEKLGRLYPNWLRGVDPAAPPGRPIAPDSEEYHQLANEILHAKTEAMKKFDMLGKWAFDGEGASHRVVSDTQQAARKLMSTIEYSQSSWTRFVRALNPVFGYLIMGLMIGGSVLAPRVSSWVGHRHSDLQQKQFQPTLFPQDSRLISPSGGGHGSHGGRASHGSTYGVPYMVWDGMNNNQPTYSGDLYTPHVRHDDSQEDDSSPPYTLRHPATPAPSTAAQGGHWPAPVQQHPQAQRAFTQYTPGSHLGAQNLPAQGPQAQGFQAWNPQQAQYSQRAY